MIAALFVETNGCYFHRQVIASSSGGGMTRLSIIYRASRALDPYCDLQTLLRYAISVANEDLYLSFGTTP